MNSSLFFKQYPACLVRPSCEIGSERPYNYCFVARGF